MAFGSLGEAFIKIRPDMRGFEAALGAGVLEGTQKALDAVDSQIQKIADFTFKRFVVPLGIGLTASTAQWQQLDGSIRETLTLLGAGGLSNVVDQQFGEMREGINAISREFGTLESDISKGLYQAISAGIPRDNVFTFMETAQKAALAGSVDMLTAVDGLTTAVNAFSASGLEVEQASDIMFKAVARGKTTFGELSADMARVAPLAANAGVSFSEFMAAVSAMTLQGTKTSEAFTFLRAAMTGLLRDTPELRAIFEQAGFASGELAIKQIGLVEAMRLVSEGAGQSSSKLIELLQGAEGANAVIQLTSEQGFATFNSVLGDTENALGSTNQALSITQDGIGRLFGQVTAGVDRLGNMSGEFAAQFIEPVLKFLVNALKATEDWGKKILGAMKPFATVFREFIGFLDNKIVANFAAAMVTLATVVTTVGSGVWAMTFAFKAVSSLLLGGFLLGRFGRLATLIRDVGTAAISTGARLKLIAADMKAVNGVTKAAQFQVSGLGRSLQFLGKLAKPGPLLALAAAVGTAVWAYGKYKERLEAVHEAQRIVTRGADILADNLGLVTAAANALPEEIVSDFAFSIQSQEVIDEMLKLRREFGGDVSDANLLLIGAKWVWQGNTPEEAFAGIQELIERGGLSGDIGFTADDILDQDKITQALRTKFAPINAEFQRSFEVIREAGANALGQRGAQGVFGEGYDAVVKRYRGSIDDVAGTLVWMSTRSFPGAIRALRLLNEDMGAGTWAARALNKAFLESINSIRREGQDPIEFDLSNVDSFVGVIQSLKEGIPNFEALMAPGLDAVDEFARGLVADTNVGVWTEEQKKAFTDLSTGMQAAISEAEQSVTDGMAAIAQAVLDQMPILTIYEGAVEQSFGAWKKGQDKFQKDLETWMETTRHEFADLPQEIQDKINASPLEYRAWLANLSPTQLETLKEELVESFNVAATAAETEAQEAFGGLAEAAQLAILEKYEDMRVDAITAGDIVAAAFAKRFRDRALGIGGWGWAASQGAAHFKNIMDREFQIESPSKYMIDVADNLADAFSSQIAARSRDFNVSPSVSPRGLSGKDGAGKVSNYNFTINNPRHVDPVLDAERFSGVIRTMELI